MYNIYHFFAFLINVRSELSSVRKLQDFHFNVVPLAYRDNAGFPALVIRMHKGYSSPSGEFVGIVDSNSYNVPSFESHIPTGAMSFDMLGHDKVAKIFNSMQAAGEVPGWIHEREVYYLIRGRNNGNTKVCLVHGRFFETTVKREYVLRQALEEALADCMEKQPLSRDQFDTLWRVLEREVFSEKSHQVSIGTVNFQLGVQTHENIGANILSSFYYPEIRDNSLNFVIPLFPAETNAYRKSSLRRVLASSEQEQGEEFSIDHPLWGKFFVLSYAL